VEALVAATGGRLAAFHGASDLRILSAAGIPCAHYGPGRIEDAHRPEESVATADFLAAAEGVARFLLAWVGPGG
jgi:acetylornithine deacetylase/succinyl-diaminopimelate desuccinylase-like protein